MSKPVDFVLLLTIGLFSTLVYADLPADIPKCKVADTDCITKSIMEVLKKYPKGNPAFGLPPIDKLSLTNMVLSESNSDGPVQLQFKLITADMYGVENAKVNRVVGFEEDPEKSKFEVYGLMPSVVIKGEYDTQGRILLLPLNGKGKSEIQLKNVKFGLKVKVGLQMKNGKRFATIKKIKVQLEPEHMKVNLENLFNGNKELGDSMIQVINENWRDIWSELGAGINKFNEQLMGNLLKEVLSKLSYDDFYKKE